MRLIAHLVAKDVKRKLRAPLGVIASLAFPIVFAGLLALAFGRGGDGIPKVRMLVANQDDGFLANAVASSFSAKQAASFFDVKAVTAEQGRELMEQGKASAMLTIPKGFTKDVVDGKRVTLRLLRNPSEGILPEIAEQTVGTLADVLEGASRVFAEPLKDLRPLVSDGNDAAPADADVIAISLAVKRALAGMSNIVFPPAIALESELFGTKPADPKAEKKREASPGAVFLLVLPGVAVYGLFLVADQGMRDIMTERTLGTLRRQLAGPVSPEIIILGKAVFTAVLAAAATVVLAVVGLSVLRTSVSLAGFVTVSAALVLAVTGTASIIYGLARTERQASTIGNMIFLLMGFLGGGFIRIEGLPSAVRAVAPFTPLYWGTQAYRALLEDHAGLSGVLTHVSVLAIMGSVFLTVGALAMRRTARHGAGA
jgi:ABC-2 type transport system permease protein